MASRARPEAGRARNDPSPRRRRAGNRLARRSRSRRSHASRVPTTASGVPAVTGKAASGRHVRSQATTRRSPAASRAPTVVLSGAGSSAVRSGSVESGSGRDSGRSSRAAANAGAASDATERETSRPRLRSTRSASAGSKRRSTTSNEFRLGHEVARAPVQPLVFEEARAAAHQRAVRCYEQRLAVAKLTCATSSTKEVYGGDRL